MLSLGKNFSILRKRYLGVMSSKLEGTPVEKYFVPLYVISLKSGKINQQQLVDELLSDKASMVRILDCLSNEGLIERIVNPNDRREHLLKVTEVGEKWVKVIEESMVETNALFISFLPEEERANFVNNLSKMTDSVMDLPAPSSSLF